MIGKIELVVPVCPFITFHSLHCQLSNCQAIPFDSKEPRKRGRHGARRSWCFTREIRDVTCELAQPLPNSQLPLIGLLGAIN